VGETVVVDVDVDVVVVVGLKGAALVVVLVGLGIVVVEVLVGNAKVVVDVDVEVEVDVEVFNVIIKSRCKSGELVIDPILKKIVSNPRPLVKKLDLATYFVPPGTKGVLSVYKGP